jgi:hypothetical protein
MIAVSLDQACVWQPDIDRAAVEAFHHIPAGPHEYGGAIYRDAAGRYCYSVPGRGKGDDSFTFRIVIPDGAALAGLYHTHPYDGGKESDTFSPDDVKVADKLDVVSYIRVARTGLILRYRPHQTKRNTVLPTGTSLALNISYGEEVTQ